MSEVYRLLGTPRFGGILVVSDHASNHVPDDISLGIDPALLNEHMALDIGVGAADRGFVERDGDETARAFFAHVSRFIRIPTERACASSPSARASAIAAGPSFASCPAPHFRIEVRFMKSSTDSPEA